MFLPDHHATHALGRSVFADRILFDWARLGEFMRILMSAIFVLFAAASSIGMLLLTSDRAPSSPAVQASADQTDPETEGAANGFSVLLAMFSGEGVEGAVAPELSGSLAAFLPEPGIGWTRTPYELAHGEDLTGATYQKSAVVISTTNSLLSSFERARRDATGTTATYRKGDEVVAISMSSRTDRDMRSLQGSMMTAIAGNLNAAAGTRPSGFGNVHGVNFSFGATKSTIMATRVEVPINYRTLSAMMGGQVSIKVMTNASDAAIAEIIGAIDIPGLNTILVSPDLAVTPGTGLITSQIEPLATTPPAPSLAYLAFQELRNDASDFSQNDVRLLQRMASGEVKGWVDVYEEYGLDYRISPELQVLLGDAPDLAPIDQVRFEAIEMLKNPAILGTHETELLEGLARQRFATRDQALRQVSATRVYKKKVIRLINLLPEAPSDPDAGQTVDASATEPARELVVRRGTTVQQGDVLGTDCAIELGVRRCTVEDVTE